MREGGIVNTVLLLISAAVFFYLLYTLIRAERF